VSWAVVPAAGRGSRFGGELPKQYVEVFGRSILHHSLLALARHAGVKGIMVALAPGDPHWPGFRELAGKPVLTCEGGKERAESVLAGLRALPTAVRDRDWVLVHDAARPCLRQDDLDRLLAHGAAHGVGALLAAPVRDTIKRVDERGEVLRTEPRDALWRALTPQLFRRAVLLRALESALAGGLAVTDEAGAMERLGLFPMVVQGAEDNIKVTTTADLAMAEFLLGRRAGE
jgi:2-C-methyl-D-erythritol 4-phosphate cytidylyltransferase